MGMYVNKNSQEKELPASGKVQMIANDGGIILDGCPDDFMENLVCVVDNYWFEAAAYAYDQAEFEAFKKDDGRSKTWMIYPHVKDVAE